MKLLCRTLNCSDSSIYCLQDPSATGVEQALTVTRHTSMVQGKLFSPFRQGRFEPWVCQHDAMEPCPKPKRLLYGGERKPQEAEGISKSCNK